MVTAKKWERVQQLQHFTSSFLHRAADQLDSDQNYDSLERRRKHHKIAVQTIVLFKMWANALEDLLDHVWDLKHDIERHWKTQGVDDREHEHETYVMALREIREMRIIHGRRILDFIATLEHFRLNLTVHEIQTALSIGKFHMPREETRADESRDLAKMVLSSIEGNAVAQQVMAATVRDRQPNRPASDRGNKSRPTLQLIQ